MHKFFIIFILVTGMSASAIAQTLTLRVGYDHRPPHRFTNEQGETVGLDIYRIKRIFDEAGIRVEFHEHPWKRNLRFVEMGEIDVLMAAAKLEDRKSYAHFSSEVFKMGRNVLLVKQDKSDLFSKFTSLAQLKSLPLKIGIRRGTSYSDEFELLLNDVQFTRKLVPLNDARQALNLTTSGRIQGFITSYEIAQYEKRKLCSSEKLSLVYDLNVNEDASTYLMFSKKTVSPETVAQVSAAMKRIDAKNLDVEKGFAYQMPECATSNKILDLTAKK